MSGRRRPVALNVNGEVRDVLVNCGDTLLQVLREQLQLTGAKRGCDQGVCGACTITVDGKPARACLALAVDFEEREIVTIEELTNSRMGRRVQEALVLSGAIQCGYCTPGIVHGLSALFRDEPDAPDERVREALTGNLCRCSGYVKIVEAARSLRNGG